MIINRIKHLRIRNDYTQAELAKKMKVSREHLDAVENSRVPISKKMAIKAAAVFNVSVDEVVGETEV